jgi:hypothetical protein
LSYVERDTLRTLGSRFGVAGIAVAGMATFASERASACSVAAPPPALVGLPADGERNVPTNVVPVYSSTDARYLNEGLLALTTFELRSAAGAMVPVTPVMSFAFHFELVPELELSPDTVYTLDVTLPPRSSAETSAELTLSFTTGSGPLTEAPEAPEVRIQHFHASSPGTSCDFGPDGSCLFFAPGTAIEITQPDSPSLPRRLTLEPWWEQLSGVNQSTPWTCVTLRARGADGTFSESVDVCRHHGETLSFPSPTGLECTENGLVHTSTGTGGTSPTGGAAGSATGGSAVGGSASGGTSSGGVSTGGISTGGVSTGGVAGTGGTAGATDDEPDSRTVRTEGCGCRIGAANPPSLVAWLAGGVALCMGALRRFRRTASATARR